MKRCTAWSIGFIVQYLLAYMAFFRTSIYIKPYTEKNPHKLGGDRLSAPYIVKNLKPTQCQREIDDRLAKALFGFYYPLTVSWLIARI